MTLIAEIKYGVGEIGYEDFSSCPLDYQQYIIRIMSIQAYAELLGANEVALQLKLAPNFRARKGLARIIYDEATHAYLLYDILEKLGVNESAAIEIAEGKKGSHKKSESLEGAIAVGDNENQWLDLVLNNMLMDRAGGHMVNNFAQSSFKPWSEACKKIFEDEQWHIKFGAKYLEEYIKGNPKYNFDKELASWYTRALNFFGPPNSKSEVILKTYGIKRKSNEELREDFRKEVSIILRKLLPDASYLKYITDSYPYKVKSDIFESANV